MDWEETGASILSLMVFLSPLHIVKQIKWLAFPEKMFDIKQN